MIPTPRLVKKDNFDMSSKKKRQRILMNLCRSADLPKAVWQN
jgi:hypothetical protein